MCFLRLFCGYFCPNITVFYYPVCEKSSVSFKNRLPQEGEHVFSGFQATEAHCKHVVPTQHLVESGSITQVKRESQWEKGKVCFSFQNNFGVGLLSHNGLYLQVVSFRHLVLCHLWGCYWGTIALASLCAAFTCLVKLHIFQPNQASLERRKFLYGGSSYWSTLQTASAHRVLTLLVALSV